MFGQAVDSRVDAADVDHGEQPTRRLRTDMALEYIACCADHRTGNGTLPRMISLHLLEILAPDLALHFNDELRKAIKDHKKTTRPQQFASLVRRVESNCAFHEALLAKRSG